MVRLKSVKDLIAGAKITHALMIAASSLSEVYNLSPRRTPAQNTNPHPPLPRRPSAACLRVAVSPFERFFRVNVKLGEKEFLYFSARNCRLFFAFVNASAGK